MSTYSLTPVELLHLAAAFSSSSVEPLYEVKRKVSQRRIFFLLGIAIGWMGSLYLGPAFKGLIQGFLLGLI